jgi:hypothetical protein
VPSWWRRTVVSQFDRPFSPILSAILLPAFFAALTSTGEHRGDAGGAGGCRLLSDGDDFVLGRRNSIAIGKLRQQLCLTDGVAEHMRRPQRIGLDDRQAPLSIDKENSLGYAFEVRRYGFQR